MTQPVAFSYSRLDNYETCPRKFWHVSVAKDIREPETEHTTYGTEVHKAIAAFMKGKPLPLHLRYLESPLLPVRNAPGEKVIEQQVAINSSYQGCDWFAKDTYCRVISDLTIINGTRAALFDWKTGKKKLSFLQLHLAAAVIMLLAPEIESASLSFFWTKSKEFTPEIDPSSRALKLFTREQIPQVFNGLAPRLQRYQDAHAREDFPARPNRLCSYCPVKSCPHNTNTR